MASGNGIPQQVGMAGPQGQLKQDTMHRGTAYPVGMAGPQGQLKQDPTQGGVTPNDTARTNQPQVPPQGQPVGGGGKTGGVPQQQQAPNINQSAAAGIQGAMAGAGREMNYRPMNVGATGYNAAQGGATGYGAARLAHLDIKDLMSGLPATEQQTLAQLAFRVLA
jgi:hypothetical protein